MKLTYEISDLDKEIKELSEEEKQKALRSYLISKKITENVNNFSDLFKLLIEMEKETNE